MTPIDRFLERLRQVKPTSGGWQACCPAHDDRKPSLSISEGDDGKVLINCHAGCSFEAVCQAIGLRPTDLMGERSATDEAGRPRQSGAKARPETIDATYDYVDESGKLLFQVVRYAPKDFRQRKPINTGKWNWSTKGVRQVPYRLPRLLADPSQPVFIVEGEKDCNNLEKLDLLATCNAGGAGKWTDDHSEYLRGRQVIILPDNDDAGRDHARSVAVSLYDVADSIRIVDLPDLPEKGDVSDWLAAGGTRVELMALIEAAEEWSPETEPWPELISFDSMELPEFPIDALPKVLRDFCVALSHATQTPVDLSAMLSLAVAAACIARRIQAVPREGWPEPVNIYVAVLLEPANRKSAVFSDVVRPLKDTEAELIAEAKPQVACAESKRRREESRLKKLEKTAVEGSSAEARKAEDEAKKLAESLALEPLPVLPRLITDDATPQKLESMLQQQGGRIASMSAEGGVFDLMEGMYSKSGTPQINVYLLAHGGDDIRTDRVGRESVSVVRPALTAAYAIQPVVIQRLLSNHVMHGRGLFARFLFSIPVSWIGHRTVRPAPVPASVRDAYHRVIRRLAEGKEELELRFSREADDCLATWETEIEVMLQPHGKLESVKLWGGKLAGATVRLAAILHCVEHGPTGQVQVATVEAAIQIARYLIPHADAIFNQLATSADPKEDDARYLWGWIERHQHQRFSRTEAHHQCKRRFRRVDEIDLPIKELVRRGYIRPMPTKAKGPGRPASPEYQVNPKVWSLVTPKWRSQYSPNEPNDFSDPDLGNNGNDGDDLDNSDRVQVTL